MYYEYHFIGMHMLWWAFWLVMLFLIFGWFGPRTMRRTGNESPLDILTRRFVSGEISVEEYQERKEILERDLPRAANPE
jgi:putative membrane protein